MADHVLNRANEREGFTGQVQRYSAARCGTARTEWTVYTHLGAQAETRVVVAHLGDGASMRALRRRRSVATTMGFPALDGLMMGTRCRTADPGVVIYLASEMQMGPAEIETT